MTIEPGQNLLHYRIVEKIGEGGMGVVWKALDTTLDRDVAIKVLPEAFGESGERMARFEREAKLLASLNHPGIAVVHGRHEADGVHFLVMELVPGEDLRQRLARGPLGVEEALGVAAQVADALETAHAQGVIHRDLKPANVVLTPDDKAKVLDFGLAKALSEGPPSQDVSESPTMSMAATSAGIILGTAGYMSPEQARGKPADRRADLWAFGVMLYEMLTGEKPFPGETVSDTLAKVLERDPDWDRLPARTPGRIRRMLRRCLAKDRTDRLQSAGDARIVIRECLADPGAFIATAETVRGSASALRRLLPWAAAPLVGLLVWLFVNPGPEPRGGAPLFAEIALPDGYRLAHGHRQAVALSPDGTRLAFVAAPVDVDPPEARNESQIYVRRMDQWLARPVPGTSGGLNPTFSPDGEWLLFATEEGLKKVDLAGGDPILLCDCEASFGIDWSSDGTIFFAGRDGSMRRVPEHGGSSETLTEADRTKGEVGHRLPHVLPGSKAILFTVPHHFYRDWERARIEALELKTGERKVLIEGGSDARYLPTGHLVFAREATLMAAPFDPRRLELTGEPVPVLQGVTHSIHTGSSLAETGLAHFSFSDTGTLAYVPGSVYPEARRRIFRVDRAGQAAALDVEPRHYLIVRVSPEGDRLMLSTNWPPEAAWIYNLSRDTLSRQTFEGKTIYGIWGPGENELTFVSNRDGPLNLYSKPVDTAGGVERLTTSDRPHRPSDWTSDGETLVFLELGEGTDFDIWTQSADAGAEPTPLLATRFNERQPSFSPGGRWMAYTSNQSGRAEIYLRSPGGSGEAVQVSSGGGTEAGWSPDGTGLYFRADDKFFAVAVMVSANRIAIGRPTELFEDVYETCTPNRSYDVGPDGRFFMIGETENEEEIVEEYYPRRLRVVQGWFDELRRVVPHGR